MRGWRWALMAISALATSAAVAQTMIALPDAPGAEVAILPASTGATVDARIGAALDKAAQAHGGIVQRAEPTSINVAGRPIRLHSAIFANAPTLMQGFLGFDGSDKVCHFRLPIAEVRALAQAVGKACASGMVGGATPPAATAGGPGAAAPARPATLAPGAHQANWAKVDGVYFQSLTTFGVGGMMIMDFEPIVLFRDGSYYEVEGPALEDIDLTASRAASPRRWGKWRRQGGTFLLTDHKGKTYDHDLQQGTFFKAYSADDAALAGPYKAVSGGGNSALGGSVTIATQSNLTFGRDGAFSNRRSTGAISGGDWTGVGTSVSARGREAGRFTANRHTLVTVTPEGKTERRFFAFGSKKTPAQLDSSMIFVGNRVYTLDN